mmetsp:Transcript_3593/g.8954  ORF Transcript_3593/g.8954 Transcript_3593/m.8954 type:complete len:213 (-) Transcript_3593:3743-4381(-)
MCPPACLLLPSCAPGLRPSPGLLWPPPPPPRAPPSGRPPRGRSAAQRSAPASELRHRHAPPVPPNHRFGGVSRCQWLRAQTQWQPASQLACMCWRHNRCLRYMCTRRPPATVSRSSTAALRNPHLRQPMSALGPTIAACARTSTSLHLPACPLPTLSALPPGRKKCCSPCPPPHPARSHSGSGQQAARKPPYPPPDTTTHNHSLAAMQVVST